MREQNLTIDFSDIALGTVDVFGFIILRARRELNGEVWALLEPGLATYTNEGTIRGAKAVWPRPSPTKISEVGKRLHVEVWELAVETRPLI